MTKQVEHELFPKFLLSDLFFRFTADPAAIAEAEAEIKAEAAAQEHVGAAPKPWLPNRSLGGPRPL